MTKLRRPGSKLPNIFPDLGPVTRFVLFADFSESELELTGEAWASESSTIIRQGLAGVASRIIRERSLQVPTNVVRQLRDAHFNDVLTAATIVKRSLEVVTSLHSAGIPFVVTKGPGIARECTNFSDRPFIDLDIVVAPSRFIEARLLLASIGYRESERTMQVWDSFNRYCREAVNLRSEDGGSIDLHHRVSPWNWSTGLEMDILKSGARSTDVFGVPLPLAAPEHNLLVASLHVVSDQSRAGRTYRIWRDLLVLASKCSVEDVVDAAKLTGLSAWLGWILECLPPDVQPAELLGRLSSQGQRQHGSWRLRMLLPPRLASNHMFGRVFRLPFPNAALFALGAIVPSPGYLHLRYPDEAHPYLTWWRSSWKNFELESRRESDDFTD